MTVNALFKATVGMGSAVPVGVTTGVAVASVGVVDAAIEVVGGSATTIIVGEGITSSENEEILT